MSRFLEDKEGGLGLDQKGDIFKTLTNGNTNLNYKFIFLFK